MDEYIDPRDEPWDYDTEEVWKWMKAKWESMKSIVAVENIEENRIKEYREITQFWKQMYIDEQGFYPSKEHLCAWLYIKKKVDEPDNVPRPPRPIEQEVEEPYF